ncbi:putative WD repeat-containing protein [Diplonema papillatum]|nr:putative WD repeat-containing protein [Diplonema papillatum]
MGCGSSANTPATKDDGDNSKKYAEGESKKSPRDKADGAPKSPRKDGKDSNSPKDNKKKKGKKVKETPRQFKRVTTMVELEDNTEAAGVTTVTLPRKRVGYKVDPKDDGFASYLSITSGQSSVARGPPEEGGTVVTLVPDFSPKFTLNLTKDESAQIKESDDSSFELGDLTLISLLNSRYRKPALKGYQLRPLCGFCKSLAAVAISPDDRLVSIAMSRGKAICPNDHLTIPGVPSLAKLSGSRHSSGSIPGQVQLKLDSFYRVIRCYDFRTAQLVGLLKRKGLEPEVTSFMEFGVDDQQLFSCTQEGSVLLWHMGRMKLQKPMEEYSSVGRLAQVRVSDNGKYVAACGEDIDDDGTTCGQVPVWLIEAGRQVIAFTKHKAPCNALAFHPKSEIVMSGDRAGMLLVWVVETGKVLKRVKAHEIQIRSIHFISESRVVTSDERFTRMWEFNSDMTECTPVWSKHLDWPVPLAFDKDDEDQAYESEEEVETEEDNNAAKRSANGSDEDNDEAEDVEKSKGIEKGKTVEMRPVTRYPLRAPPNQGKIRQRLSLTLPCGIILQCLSIKEIYLLSVDTGELVANIDIPSFISCGQGGRSAAVLGDVQGNVYALDLEMTHALPTFT